MSGVPLQPPAIAGCYLITYNVNPSVTTEIYLFTNNLLGAKYSYRIIVDKSNRLTLYAIDPITGAFSLPPGNSVLLATTPQTVSVNVTGNLLHVLADGAAKFSLATGSSASYTPASQIQYVYPAPASFNSCMILPPITPPPAPTPTPGNRCGRRRGCSKNKQNGGLFYAKSNISSSAACTNSCVSLKNWQQAWWGFNAECNNACHSVSNGDKSWFGYTSSVNRNNAWTGRSLNSECY